MGNFLIQDQWENQKQDGRTSFGGTHHRSYGYENGGTSRRQRRLLWEARAKKEL